MTNTDRPRRCEPTRQAILQAARERFACEGYDRTTIRAIAADANIDPSMVMRYFGNKEQLFAAAAKFDLHAPDLSETPPEERADRLVRHFIRLWEGDLADSSLQILLRCALTNETAAERMRLIFAEQVIPLVTTGIDPDEAVERSGLVASQMLGLALCRYVLRLPAVVALDSERLATWIAPTIRRYLTEPRAPIPSAREIQAGNDFLNGKPAN
ncbi:MAG: TetR family transcriptional regulator [Methylococcaceae bacterium]|nr:TetR family transcriptional regulator [Methylococcaceae bacterium]